MTLHLPVDGSWKMAHIMGPYFNEPSSMSHHLYPEVHISLRIHSVKESERFSFTCEWCAMCMCMCACVCVCACSCVCICVLRLARLLL